MNTCTRITIGCGTDDNFAFPLAVTLQSVVEKLRPGVGLDVWLIDGGMSPATRLRLERNLARHSNLQLHMVKPSLNGICGLKQTTALPTATYLRLLLPELLPADISKVIYLDCDLLIRADLTRLWDTELKGTSLGAVQDYRVPLLSSDGGVDYCISECGIPEGAPLCNGGILVMDLARWREKELAGKCMQFLQAHAHELRYADQDAVNVICVSDWEPLDARWNMQACGIDALRRRAAGQEQPPFTGDADQVLRDPFIVHYTGAFKPWVAGFRHPFGNEYVATVEASEWFNRAQFVRWRLDRAQRTVRRAVGRRLARKELTVSA